MADFYATLEEIHKKQNIVLQREPILGGKKLDLFKIYSYVQANGGYAKVTTDHRWKSAIADQFDLPLTCTNSAFVFKQLYQKHLMIFETLEKTGKSVDEILDIKPTEPKRQKLASDQPNTNEARKSTQSIAHYSEDDNRDEKYLQGGWQNKLALALKSGLPNEVDWAFNKLIKLSFQHHFYVGYIPSLPETLLDVCNDFFDELCLNTSPNNFETSLSKNADLEKVPPMTDISLFNIKSSAIMLERVLQALHVIRNMSFMNENAIAFSRDHKLLTILAKALALPSITFYVEVQQHALDIFENIARLLILRGPSDFYLACLKKMVFESDRSRILGALKSMIKLISNEMNEKVIMQIDTAILQRMLQLLLVPDEDIVAVCLDFFYLFTNISPDAGARITGCVRFNVLKLLLKFIHWRGFGIDVFNATIDRSVSRLSSTLPTPPPDLPPHALDHFHAAMWLKIKCESDESATYLQSNMFSDYTSYCQRNVLSTIQLPELLKLSKKMHPDISVAHDVAVIYGLKPKLEAPVVVEVRRDESFDCGIIDCDSKFDNAERLDEHVRKHRFKSTICQWKHCGVKFEDQESVTHHLMTHVPLSSSHIRVEDFKLSVVDHGDLRGIPLSALLVIRNIARHSGNHGYFAPFEKDIATLLTNSKFNKTAAAVLAELK